MIFFLIIITAIFKNKLFRKLSERVCDYSKTKLINDPKFLKKAMLSPMFKQDNFLGTESGEGIFEIITGFRRIRDQKPVHLGVSILQHSKMGLKAGDLILNYLILLN